ASRPSRRDAGPGRRLARAAPAPPAPRPPPAAAPGAMEVTAPVPLPGVGANADLRHDLLRTGHPRDGLGSVGEGAEPPFGAGSGTAAPWAGHDPRGRGRAERARGDPGPGPCRGRTD